MAGPHWRFPESFRIFAASASTEESTAAGLAIGRLLGEQGDLPGDLAPLALEVVGDGAAQAGVGNVVRAVGLHRQIAPGELVRALRAGLDASELARDGELDGLVVAGFEMQEGPVFNATP